MPQRASASVPSVPLCHFLSGKWRVVAHASASLRHRLFVGFGRNMPSASFSLASFIISYAYPYFVHNLYIKPRPLQTVYLIYAQVVCTWAHKIQPKNYGEPYTLHSNLLKFPKFTRSPHSIPVDFR